MSRRRQVRANRNSHISTLIEGSAVNTQTAGRDDDTMTAQITTNVRGNCTFLFIDTPKRYRTLSFTGAEARTLYRLLQKHYTSTGKDC